MSHECRKLVCSVKLEGKRSRGTERQFCDDHCRVTHWILKKAAKLLAPLEQSKSWEILLKLSILKILYEQLCGFHV
jgi:hypothetical protein